MAIATKAFVSSVRLVFVRLFGRTVSDNGPVTDEPISYCTG